MTHTTIEQLLQTPAYRALKKVRSEFDLIGFLDETIAQSAWFKIAAFLFDSRASHGMEQEPVRLWLKNIASLAYHDIAGIIENLPKPTDCETRTYLDWQAPGARPVDILLEFADLDGESQVIIGIQNKFGAGDDHDHFHDCQEVLRAAFPDIPIFIVALEGHRRGLNWVDDPQLVPFMHASAGTIIDACATLAPRVEGQQRLLLEGLCSHMESKVLRINKMDQQAHALVMQLFESREHRQALKQIAQFLPTLRTVSEHMLGRLKQSFLDLPQVGAHASPILISYFPTHSISPKEIKIEFVQINTKTEPHRLWIAYVLDSDATEPDVGDSFTLRLMAWWDNEHSREVLQMLNLKNFIPASVGKLEGWANWEPLWVGKSYQLQDLGILDAEGLTDIALDGITKTYSAIRDRIMEKTPPI